MQISKQQKPRNLSDTSTESGFASQVSGSTNNNSNNDDNKYKIEQVNHDANDKDDEELISNEAVHARQTDKDQDTYWKETAVAVDNHRGNPSPVSPLAISSPTLFPPQTDDNNNDNRTNNIKQQSSPSLCPLRNRTNSVPRLAYPSTRQQGDAFDFDHIPQDDRHYLENHQQYRNHNNTYHQNPFKTLSRVPSNPSSLYIDTRERRTVSERYLRPSSARTDIYRTNTRQYANSVVGSRSMFLSSNTMKSRKDYYNNPNYAYSCATLPTRTSNVNLNRKETFRSIGGPGSSVSQVLPPPNYSTVARSVCSCGTLGEPGLSDIKEEMPIFAGAFSEHNKYTYEKRVQKMKYIAVFLVVFAAICFTVGGFLHFYVGYFPEEFVLNQGDVKLLSIDSMFCRGVQGSSENGQLRLITFESGSSDRPETKRLQYTRTKEDFKIFPKQVWKRDFYLLASSQVDITIETESLLDLMVFKGENSMSIWETRKESESYLLRDSCCSNKYPRRDTIKFTASATDRYFIVLYSRTEIIPVSVKLFRVQFNRLTYDFSNTVSSCKTKTSGEECTVEYPLTGDSRVAVEVPLVENLNEISTSASLKYICVPREWMYCLFFTGLFILTVLLIIALYYLVIRICIPSKSCCWYRNDLKKNISLDIVYYDNHGRAMSELYLDQNFDSVSHARSYAPSRRSAEVKSLYHNHDTASLSSSRHPRSVGGRRHNHHSVSRASTLPRNAFSSNNSAAAIFKDGYAVDVERADSGISMNPELSPSGISSVTAQEAYKQKYPTDESRYQQMQQKAFDLVNGPPVKHLLKERPKSLAGDRDRSYHHQKNPPNHRRYQSQPDRNVPIAEYNPKNFDIAFPDDVDCKPHHLSRDKRHPPKRSQSARDPTSRRTNSTSNFFQGDDFFVDENGVKQIDYDDREIFI